MFLLSKFRAARKVFFVYILAFKLSYWQLICYKQVCYLAFSVILRKTENIEVTLLY